MRGPLPRHVDPWKAAAGAEQLEGVVERARLVRLCAVVTPVSPLEVRMQFATMPGLEGRAVRVTLHVGGRFAATCQRCLEPLEFEQEVAGEVLVVPDDATARGIEAHSEVMVSPCGEPMDPAALVEDEVMLALPFAPCHETGQCASALESATGTQQASGGRGEREGKENPFAALAALKSQRPQD